MRAVSIVISSLLIFVILLSLSVAAYLWAKPMIERHRDVAVFEGVKAQMESLNAAIERVAHQGKNSRRNLKFHIPKGRIILNSTQDLIYYEIETDAKIVEPGADVREEGLILWGSRSPRGKYLIKILLNFSSSAIDIEGNTSAAKGYYTVKVENLGVNNSRVRVLVEFS